MPVSQMLHSLTSSELTEYMAFDSLEPIGEPRADLRAGIIASTFVNHSMSPPKRAATAVDFMPFVKKRSGPIKLKDPAEHGKLIATSLFAGLSVKSHRKN